MLSQNVAVAAGRFNVLTRIPTSLNNVSISWSACPTPPELLKFLKCRGNVFCKSALPAERTSKKELGADILLGARDGPRDLRFEKQIRAPVGTRLFGFKQKSHAAEKRALGPPPRPSDPFFGRARLFFSERGNPSLGYLCRCRRRHELTNTAEARECSRGRRMQQKLAAASVSPSSEGKPALRSSSS